MLYDLSMLKDAGVDPAEFIRCNNQYLDLQRSFIEDLLDFAEGCEAKGVAFEADKFLISTMEGLLRYVQLLCKKD